MHNYSKTLWHSILTAEEKPLSNVSERQYSMESYGLIPHSNSNPYLLPVNLCCHPQPSPLTIKPLLPPLTTTYNPSPVRCIFTNAFTTSHSPRIAHHELEVVVSVDAGTDPLVIILELFQRYYSVLFLRVPLYIS